MAPVHTLDVERYGPKAFADGLNLGCSHEQKDGGRIDETPDQPRACDAVDLGPRARDPDRSSFRIALRKSRGWNAWQLLLRPRLGAAVQNIRGRAGMAKPCGDAPISSSAIPWSERILLNSPTIW